MPSKLTAEKAETILQALRAGAWVEVAAARAAVHKATVHRWVSRGEALIEASEADDYDWNGETPDDKRYRLFAEEVGRARADAEVRATSIIIKASDEDWKAAAWYLERSRPQRWSQTTKTEVTGADGGPISVSGDDALSAALKAAQESNEAATPPAS